MSFSNSKDNMINTLGAIDSKKMDSEIQDLAKKIMKAFDTGGKVLICGNGGSSAEAEHFVAELVCKFEVVRKALPAMTLHSNIPTVTAIGNDFSFNNIFSRNLEALGNKNDILITMSTSGNSQNVINVLQMAKKMNIYTFSLLGNDGGKMKTLSNDNFIVKSNIVSTIQEIHLIFLHALCVDIDKLAA